MDSIVNLASIPNLVPLLHSPHFLRELAFIDDLLRHLAESGMDSVCESCFDSEFSASLHSPHVLSELDFIDDLLRHLASAG
jgi:hypothetical protein